MNAEQANEERGVRNAGIFGDSILRGIQLDREDGRYRVDNHIDLAEIGRKHSLVIYNFSMFGCTIRKGISILQKRLEKRKVDIAVIEYGGNDCDFNWKEIAERPTERHEPHTPLNVFAAVYHQIIHILREKCIIPVLTTLPPLEPQRFFDWFCGSLNRDNILLWLGSVSNIYRFQENYSRVIGKIAAETKSLLIDLRGAFLEHRRSEDLLCEDGIHPNTAGQEVITGAFLEFKAGTG
jgi:lysophospholipase L1-like esterase